VPAFDFTELRRCKAEDHPAFSQTLVLASYDMKKQWALNDPKLDKETILANGTLNTESKFTYVNVWLTTCRCM
jgi:hypothetical protein